MHIAIFVDFHDSTIGGVQTSVRGQRKGLEKLGHTVTIVSPPPAVLSEDDPSTIIVPSLPFVRPNGFAMVAPTRRNQRYIEHQLDKRDPIDIIHVQTNIGVGTLGIKIAKERAIPLVQTMHGRDDVFAENTYPLPALTTALLRAIHRYYVPHTTTVSRLSDTRAGHNAWQVMINAAQKADHVIVPSQHFKAKFQDHGLTKPIDVISNGISDEVVAQLPVVPHKKSKDGVLRVIWCGRLSPEKRLLESIKAVASMPKAQLDIYGSGPLFETAQQYLQSHDLTDRIHLKGKVEQMAILRAMQEHDVLLYPSYGFDNQPMVLLEAVAAGLPIVYCDPDLTECMPAGGGLLTTNGTTIHALTDALKQLQQHPAERTRMHQIMLAYRAKIVQSYHSKKMVALYERLSKRH